MTIATQVEKIVWTVAPASDWQTGFNLYIAGESESACKNTSQVEGWWAALDAEAACNVCDRMAANGKSGAEMDDTLDGLTYHEWRKETHHDNYSTSYH